MNYKAFISYSHAADNQLAPKLQKALQQFAKPFYKLNALSIFRDQTSLVSTPELWPTIQKALHASEYFILLASKDAAQSTWVQKEVQEWLDTHNGSVEQMLIVLTNDTIVWDNAANDFDWKLTDAIPHNLKGKFTSEPLFVDLKWARTEKEVTLKSPNFADAVATLSAPLRGVPKEEIYGEEIKQHKRFRQVASVVILLLLMLATVAFLEYSEASRKKKEAQKLLTNNFWSSAKQALLNNRVLEYWYTLSQAIGSSGEGEVTEQLFKELEPQLPAYRLVNYFDTTVHGAVLDKAGHRVLSWGKEGSIQVYEAATGKELCSMKQSSLILGAVFSAKEDQVISWGNEEVNLWDASNGQRIAGPFPNKVSHDSVDYIYYGALLTKDGGKIFSWGLDELKCWETSTGKELTLPNKSNSVIELLSIDGTGYTHYADKIFSKKPKDTGIYIKGAVLTKEENNILFWTRNKVKVWDIVNTKNVFMMRAKQGFNGASFSQDETKILTWENNGGVCLWNVKDGALLLGPLYFDKSIDEMDLNNKEVNIYRSLSTFIGDFKAAFKGEGLILASCSKGIVVWDVDNGSKLVGPLVYNDGIDVQWTDKFGATYSKDGENILCWGPDGVRIVNVDKGKSIEKAFKHNSKIKGAFWSKDEKEILSWSPDEVRLWDRKTGIVKMVIRHQQPILGAQWSNDEQHIISWGMDGVKVWERVKKTNWNTTLNYDNVTVELQPSAQDSLSGIEVDLDFPQGLEFLQLQAITGTTFDATLQNAYALPRAEWAQINKDYSVLAEEHFKSCQYPKANYWHRYHQEKK